MDDTMHTIVEIADSGSISRAARKLHLSQPAVSQRLHLEELVLGISLFDRSKTPIRPTYAGSVYLKTARKLIKMEDDMEESIGEIADGRKRRLRVGVTSQRATIILPDVLREFYRRVPGCIIVLETCPCLELEAMLDEGEIDLALGPPRFDTTFYSNETIAEEHIVLAVPRSIEVPSIEEPGLSFPVIEASSMASMPMIVPSKKMHFGKVLWNIFDCIGAIPDTVMECNSTSMSLSMAKEGLGAALCSTTFISRGTDINYYLIRGYEDTQIYSAAYRRDWGPPEDARIFIDLLKERLGYADLRNELDGKTEVLCCFD